MLVHIIIISSKDLVVCAYTAIIWYIQVSSHQKACTGRFLSESDGFVTWMAKKFEGTGDHRIDHQRFAVFVVVELI